MNPKGFVGGGVGWGVELGVGGGLDTVVRRTLLTRVGGTFPAMVGSNS